jgi:hypothetical protein
MKMRKISIYETVLCDLTIYWMVIYSFVVVIYMPSYKLLGTEHFITDGGERGGFAIHICREKIVSPSFRKKCICLFPWTHGNLFHLSVNIICVNKLLLSIDIFLFFIAHENPTPTFFINEMVGSLQVLCYKYHCYHSWNMFLRKIHFQCSGDTCPLLKTVWRPQYDTLYLSIFLWIIVT